MSSVATSRFLRALLVGIAFALLVLAGIHLGRMDLTASTRALVLLVGGSVALLVLGFPRRDILTALGHAMGRSGAPGDLRRSARVWTAAARNAWVLGALAATTGFVAHFCSGFEEIEDFVMGLGNVAVAVTYGLGLAAVLGLPVLRLSQRLGEADLPPGMPSSPEPQAALSWERLPAYGLFAVLVVWPLLSPGASDHFHPSDWLVHWPAILGVAGGGLAAALYLGFPKNGEALTLGLASAGVLATLLGLAQTLRGFASTSIEMVTAGLTLLVSACFVSLVALASFGLPWQDRAQAPDARAPSVASRAAWYGIPFLALVALVITTLAVVTPMKRKMPAPDESGPATEAPVSQRGSAGPPGIC